MKPIFRTEPILKTFLDTTQYSPGDPCRNCDNPNRKEFKGCICHYIYEYLIRFDHIINDKSNSHERGE